MRLPGQPLIVDFDEWRSALKWPLWKKAAQVIIDRWHRRHARAIFVASQYMQRGFEERASQARALTDRTAGLSATAVEGDGIVEVTVGSTARLLG